MRWKCKYVYSWIYMVWLSQWAFVDAMLAVMHVNEWINNYTLSVCCVCLCISVCLWWDSGVYVFSMHIIERTGSCLPRTGVENVSDRHISYPISFDPALLLMLSLCWNIQNRSYMVDLVPTESLFFNSTLIFSNHITLIRIALHLQSIPGTQSIKQEHHVQPVKYVCESQFRIWGINNQHYLLHHPVSTTNTKSIHANCLNCSIKS